MASRRAKVTLQPDVLLWARKRADLSREDLAAKMKVSVERVTEWEETGSISFAQADRLAARTHTPVGFLYLSEPPEDNLPIGDFRTRHAKAPPRRPSVELLDTVYAMQRRQAWMQEDLIDGGAEPLRFVGTYSSRHSHREVARAMRDALGLDADWAKGVTSWTDALRLLRNTLDNIGVLVIFNGVVGNNTSRKLDPDEFQGFALVDEYAPLIFVNNADFVAAKMFTLAHELAHIFVGESGVSQFEKLQPSQNATERFCDKAAAEFLVPESRLRTFWASVANVSEPYVLIAREFKVSVIVAARRVWDLGLIERDEFFDFYNVYMEELKDSSSKSSGGNFWNTQRWRLGIRFAGAVVRAAKEGRLSYHEAYSLTGLTGKAFDDLSVRFDITL